MPTASSDTIVVAQTPAQSGAITGARYVIAMLLTFLAAKGYLPADQVGAVAGQIVAVGIALFGIYKSVKGQTQKIVAAGSAANSVAQVVGPAAGVLKELRK